MKHRYASVALVSICAINMAFFVYLFYKGSLAFQRFVDRVVPEEQAYVLLGNCDYLIEHLDIDDTPQHCVSETYRRAEAFKND